MDEEMPINQPSYMFSAWENYQEWIGDCPDCEWQGSLDSAKFEYETAMVSSLHCPQCSRKIALMSNEATAEEIIELAARGSKAAIAHLKGMQD